MSIALLLYKQSLLARKNNLQAQAMKNFDAQRSLLNSAISFNGAKEIENNLEMENTVNSSILTAINCELNSLNNLDFFA